MLPCSHKYFLEKHWDILKTEDYNTILNPDIRNIAVGYGPDLDFVFNKWPSLMKIYWNGGDWSDEVLHRDCKRIVSLSMEPDDNVLHDIRCMNIHNLQDLIVHDFIGNYLEELRGDVSSALGKEASDADIHDTVEIYLENKVIETSPEIPDIMSRSLYRTKGYRPDIANLFAKAYEDHGVKSRSFLHAMKIAYVLGRRRLKNKKYSRYFATSGYEARREYSSLEVMVNYLIENLGLHMILDNESIPDYLNADLFDETRPIPSKLGGKARKALDSFFRDLGNDGSVFLK